MKRLLFATALTTLAGTSIEAHAQEASMEYTVVAGDTCEKVAEKFWGDPKRYDKLHEWNPQMGPTPHKLVPGTILRVVRPGPLAKVTFVRHDVDAATPAPHKAQLQEPLAQGNKVSTKDDSSAEVTFKDDSRLQLSEQTLVVILGGTMHLADKQATAADTQLMTGELRAHLGTLAGKKPIATPGATIVLGNGEAKVDVDTGKTTRLAVYKGKGSLAASGKKVEVPSGYGSKADLGKPPTKPRPLPDAPTWTTTIPRVALTFADGVDVSGAYAAGVGTGPKADTFHVQLARDPAFNDLVVNAKVPSTITKLEAKQLPPATYYARVSGIDGDKFEGPFGAVATITVAKVVALVAPGKTPQIEVPKGLFCGFDGAKPSAVEGPLDVPLGKQRTLRCSATAEGEGAAEIVVDGTPPHVSLSSRFEAPDYVTYGGRDRKLVLTLTDDAGKPVHAASIAATAPAGATVDQLQEITTGTYMARVRWGQAGGKIAFLINGAQSFEVELPKDAPPPAAKVEETPTLRRFELGLGLGAISARDRLGVGGALAIDGSANLALSRHVVFGFGARAGYERFGVQTGDDSGTSLHDGDVFALAVPLTLRFGSPSLMPYLAITPQVLFGRVKTTEATPASTTPRPPSTSTTYDSYTDLALGTGAGLRVALGSRAWFLLEAGYRFAKTHDDVGFGGPYATLGLRVAF
jgi:hypothetical protein